MAGEYEENYLQLDEINKLKKEINRIHEISREIEIDKKWSLIQSLIVEIEYLNKVSSSFRLKEYNNEIIDFLMILVSLNNILALLDFSYLIYYA